MRKLPPSTLMTTGFMGGGGGGPYTCRELRLLPRMLLAVQEYSPSSEELSWEIVRTELPSIMLLKTGLEVVVGTGIPYVRRVGGMGGAGVT